VQAAKLYDLLAPAYARVITPMLEAANARAVERLTMCAPASALEIGVGPGHALAGLADGMRRVVGLDISGAMLRQASTRVSRAAGRTGLVRGDALRLPFGEGAFEAVLSTFLLDLLPSRHVGSMLCELCRVLAPGGRAVLGVMELPNPVIARAWMMLYRVVPDALGGCRPVDLSGALVGQPLRLVRDERLDGPITVRITTLVKVTGMTGEHPTRNP
jgi:ubiquinone/menaquinone biosynthesis C-methylase UbiE